MSTFCWNCASPTLNPYQACPNCSKAVRDMPAPNEFPKWPTYPPRTTAYAPVPPAGVLQARPGWETATRSPGDAWQIERQRRAEAAYNAVEPTPTSVLRIASAAAVAGIVIGSFAPWVSFGFGSVSGTAGDGKITLALGVGIGLCWIPLMTGAFQKALNALAGIASLFVLGIGIYDWGNISNGIEDEGRGIFGIGVGWGLQMMVVAAVLGLVVAVAALRGESSDA